MTVFAPVVAFSFLRSRFVCNCMRLLKLRRSKESVGFSKFWWKREKVQVSMKNGSVMLVDAVTQCGDALTVDEENILVTRKTLSPVPPCDVEATENLEVGLLLFGFVLFISTESESDSKNFLF